MKIMILDILLFEYIVLGLCAVVSIGLGLYWSTNSINIVLKIGYLVNGVLALIFLANHFGANLLEIVSLNTFLITTGIFHFIMTLLWSKSHKWNVFMKMVLALTSIAIAFFLVLPK